MNEELSPPVRLASMTSLLFMNIVVRDELMISNNPGRLNTLCSLASLGRLVGANWRNCVFLVFWRSQNVLKRGLKDSYLGLLKYP